MQDPNELVLMAASDNETETPKEAVVEDVGFLPSETQNTSPAFSQNQGMQTAIIKSQMLGSDPAKEYLNAKTSSDPAQTLRQAVIDKSNNDIKAVDDYVKDQFDRNPASIDVLTKQYPLLIKEYQSEHSSSLASELAVTEHLTNPDHPFEIKEVLRQKTAVNLAVNNSVQELLKESGMFNTYVKGLLFQDFLLMGLPQERTITNLIESKQDIVFTSPAKVQEFVARWHSLPADRQQTIFPELKKQVLEAASGDQYEAAKFLMRLLDPTIGSETKGELYTSRFLTGLAGVGGLLQLSRVAKGAVSLFDASTNAIKMTSDVGNKSAAGQWASVVITDQSGVASEAMKVNKTEAVQMASPLDLSAYDNGFSSGLAPHIQSSLRSYYESLAATQKSLEDASSVLHEGLLSKTEQEAVAQKKLDEFVNLNIDAYNRTDVKAVSAQYSNLNDHGATLSVQLNVPGTGILKKNIVFNRDDVTGVLNYSEIPSSDTIRYVTGPSFKYFNALRPEVESYIRASYGTQKVTAALKDAAIESGYLKLQGASQKRLNQVLLAGDEYIHPTKGNVGKTYTPDELLGGVQTAEGRVSLTTSAEIEGYYKARAYTRFLGELDNYVARTQLEQAGWKSAFVSDTSILVKPVSQGHSVKRLYDTRNGQMTDMSALDAEFMELQKQGYSIKMIKDDHLSVQAIDSSIESARYILLKNTEVKELPRYVMQLREGYVPKINKNGEFFAKKKVSYVTNGEASVRLATERQFASLKDAKQYVDGRNEELVKQGKPEIYQVMSDREQTLVEQIGAENASRGGLVFGSRKTDLLTQGLQGVRPERVSFMEAIDRNINILANHISKNDIRTALQQKFINTAKQLGIASKSFSEITVPETTKQGRKFMDLKRTIAHWSGIPGAEESAWQGAIQSIHDWALTGARQLSPSKQAVSSLLWLKHTDPAQALRTATFHLFLGLYNPSSLLVQSSQALVPLSRSPISGGAALALYPALNLMEYTQNSVKRLEMLKKLSRIKQIKDSKLEISSGLLDEMYAGWDKSGLRYAAKQNANFEHLENGVGLTNSIIQKTINNGLVFYNTGVNYGNKIAYMTNYLDWKIANPKLKLTDDVLKTILTNTDRDLLHMNNANRAWVNQGNAGLVTQFSQIIVRAVEAMAGKEYTLPQKMRIGIGQVAMYGLAGVAPVGIADYAMRSMGVEPSKMNDSEREAYKGATQGFLGYYLLHTFGMDSDVSQRASILAGISQWTADIVLDDRPFWQSVFNKFPAGSILTRGWQAMSSISTLLIASAKSRTLTKADLLVAANELASLPSSLRNIQKALIMERLNVIADRNGLPIVSKDFSLQEELAQAFGFSPSAVRETYDLLKYNQSKDSKLKSVANTYIHFASQFAQQYSILETNHDFNGRLESILTLMTQGLNELEMGTVLNMIRLKIESPETKQEKAVSDFIKNTYPTSLFNILQETKQHLFDSGMLKNTLETK